MPRLLPIALLAACTSAPRVPRPAAPSDTTAAAALPVPASGPVRVYRCADGARFAVRPAAGDSLALALRLREVTLARRPAASGERWGAATVEFWTKGDTARLVDGGAVRTGCVGTAATSPWEAARLLGVEFRAVGQEPGWVVEVDLGERLRYLGDYGRTQLVTPMPAAPIVDPAGVVTYAVRTEAHALTLVVRERPCQDAMSGAAFTHTVALTVDGRALAGCGRVLETGDLTGARWRLVLLDGAMVPPRDDARTPHLRVLAESGLLSGHTGCNAVRGAWVALGGDRVRLGPLVQTFQGCLEPADAARERAMLRAIERTDRYTLDGDRLTLVAAGQPVAVFVAEYLR